MIAWWQGLSARDRRILGWGGGFAALLLLYGLLWAPLADSRNVWRQRAIAADQSALWMRRTVEQIGGTLTTTAVSQDGRSLLARVDAGARDAGLGGVLLRVEPVDAQRVRVYFQSAPFDRLSDWLQPLTSGQGVRVEELSLQRAAGVGLVDARLTLAEAGAK